MANRATFKQQNSFGPGNPVSEHETYEMKLVGAANVQDVAADETGSSSDANQVAAKKGTSEDEKDMYRMNKTQELQRNFRFLSIFGYSLVLGNAWVLALVSALLPLTNGGSAGGIWGNTIVTIGMCFSMLSMAEMASMAPTAGGQYHWVSEFAAKEWQKPLSYIVGWLSVLGWQTALCGSGYSAALAIQAMIAVNDDTYTHPAWHSVLLTIGIVIFSIIFNTVFLRKLPMFEGIMLIIHIFAFFAIFVTLWVMGDQAPAEETWFHFTDYSGWNSLGLATLVGTAGASTQLLGSDSAAHLAEELKDASWVLPRSMAVTAVVNYILCFLITVTYMTVKGATVDQLLATTYGDATYVQIFMNATQSKSGTIALTALVFILLVFGVINQVTTSSRQLYAFARDGGLPWSPFLSRVRPGWDVPLNAVLVTIGFSIIVSMIILGSPTAFWTIGNLCGVALFSSYIICIGCIAWRRIRGLPLLPSRFDLGQFGLTINLMAIAMLLVFWFFMFWPPFPNPGVSWMNWGAFVYGVVIIWAFIYYYLRAKKHYQGPVEYVRKLE